MQNILLFLITMSLVIPQNVQAKPAPAPEPITILTYYQFTSLRKADQVKYLKELKKLLQMVRLQSKVSPYAETKEIPANFFQLFMIPEAHAVDAPLMPVCQSGFDAVLNRATERYECALYREGKCNADELTLSADGDLSAYCSPKDQTLENRRERYKSDPYYDLKTGKSTRGNRVVPPKKDQNADEDITARMNGDQPVDDGATPGTADDTAATPGTTADQPADDAAVTPAKKKKLEGKEKEAVCRDFTCNTERMSVKEKFETRRKDTNRRCIMGGLPSTYNYTTRKCRAVPMLKIGTKNYKCNTGETMCSPLIFGVKADNEAICIPVQLEATKTCYEQSNSESTLKYLNTPPEPVTTEDLAEAWNEMRIHIAELCREERSAAYHCTECTTIWKRLREMNKVSPCADACGQTDSENCRGRIPRFDGTNPADGVQGPAGNR